MARFIKTKLELCQILQIDRKTLDRALCELNAPRKTKKGWNLAKVGEWVKACAQTEGNLAKRDDTIRDLKRQEIELRLHRGRLENQVFEKKLMPREQVFELYRFTVEKTKQHFLSIPQKAIGRFGHMGTEIEKWVMEEILEGLRTMQNEFDEPKL